MPKIYLLHRIQRFPISIETAWEFFSSPENLKTITPAYMGFQITSPLLTKTTYAGMIISYVVKPFMNLGVKWITEVTHAQEPNYFVDEQRFGPYRFWHHQHSFTAIENGVEMVDLLHYALPFGFLGRIAHTIIVKDKIKEIFDYRKVKLKEIFNELE